jgi:hypothetical protein
MTSHEVVRRLLTDAPGDPICVACLAGVIGATHTDTQGIVDALLATDTFERGWTCGSCSRARATIAYIRKCAHCSTPLDPADRGSRMGGELFHGSCLRRLVADDTIRLSTALGQRSRDLIEQSRWRMRSPSRPRRLSAGSESESA